MKITHVTLCDYNRLLRVSRIREISIDFESNNIQLILGSNGSGKSSLMHELFPFPPTKPSFGKSGFKSLSLQHNGVDYKLTYEPGSGHQFFTDGKNLNIGGTNEIQKDLIREHLGLTNDIHTILKCSLNICDIPVANRRKLLMNLNPIDLSVFFDRYKKVHTDTVAYGNNLDRLYARQRQLMTQRIPEEQYQMMLKQKTVLEEKEKNLLVLLTSVGGDLEKYPEIEGQSEITNEIKAELLRLFKLIPKYADVSNRHYQTNFVEYSTKAEMLSGEISDIETTITDTIAVLEDYERKKYELNQNNPNIEEELRTLNEKCKDFSFGEDFTPIPIQDIPDVNTILDKVREALLKLTYIEYSEIISKNSITELYKSIISIKAEIDQQGVIHKQYHHRITEIQQSIRDYVVGKNCEKEACELLSMYTKHNDTKKEELNQIKLLITTTETNIEKLKQVHETQSDLYNTQQTIWSIIDAVISMIAGNRFLSLTFNRDRIVQRIIESPMLLVDDIVDYIINSEAYDEYLNIRKRILELNDINNTNQSKMLLSMELIDNEIQTNSKRLASLRGKHHKKLTKRDDYVYRKSHVSEFISIKSQIIELKSSIEEIKVRAEQKANREYLLFVIKTLNTLLDRIRIELIDVTTVCKDQELLINRLDKEVDSVISDLRPKYEQAKLIEKSLYELPIKYTKSFVNSIIETTNYFINEIATYQMYLIPVNDDEECSFTFPIVIEGDNLKDINQCSDGQKAIIQLAFNLAIVVELKYNDYPLYFDEMNRSLDEKHCQRLAKLLHKIVENGIVSQLFIIGHTTSFLDAFGNGDTVVLNPENITPPLNYNSHTSIVYN